MCHERRDEQFDPDRIDLAALDRIGGLIAHFKKHLTNLAQIGTGARVVDVGCGPGTDTVRIAQIVGSTGLAVGIDRDQQMIAEAQERAQRAGVAAWTRFEATDAAAIPYGPNFFDAAYCERLFQHVAHPAAVLGQMVRVTKPQGRLVVADSDWATLSIDTTEVGIERRICHALPGMVANGYAGRQLLRLFRMYPLVDVAVEVCPVVWRDFPIFWGTSFSLPDIEARLIDSGVVSVDELKRFRASLASAQEAGTFFAHANMVVVTGKKQRDSGDFALAGGATCRNQKAV